MVVDEADGFMGNEGDELVVGNGNDGAADNEGGTSFDGLEGVALVVEGDNGGELGNCWEAVIFSELSMGSDLQAQQDEEDPRDRRMLFKCRWDGS